MTENVDWSFLLRGFRGSFDQDDDADVAISGAMLFDGAEIARPPCRAASQRKRAARDVPLSIASYALAAAADRAMDDPPVRPDDALSNNATDWLAGAYCSVDHPTVRVDGADPTDPAGDVLDEARLHHRVWRNPRTRLFRRKKHKAKRGRCGENDRSQVRSPLCFRQAASGERPSPQDQLSKAQTAAVTSTAATTTRSSSPMPLIMHRLQYATGGVYIGRDKQALNAWMACEGGSW
jgi:hypothetical protein